MYRFERTPVGRFLVHKAATRKGDTHLKRFKEGVTPRNQETANIYAEGEFEFRVGDFRQVLTAGQTNLDLEIAKFPAGEISTETVLSTYGLRYCVSPRTGGAFTREVTHVVPGTPKQFSVETLVFVLSGSITVAGISAAQAAYLLVPANTDIEGEAALLAVA